MFIETWEKYRQNAILSPLEQDIASMISIHPEFHDILENPHAVLNKDFHPELGEVNPFLHLSLHLTLLDQIKTNRPQGIVSIYTCLVQKYQNEHDAAHRMIDVLQDILWLSQKKNQTPDEVAYYLALSELVR